MIKWQFKKNGKTSYWEMKVDYNESQQISYLSGNGPKCPVIQTKNQLEKRKLKFEKERLMDILIDFKILSKDFGQLAARELLGLEDN